MSGTGPTVSVIIPAHQAERFMAESIESVLAQDRPADELVIVDDGSTDRTAEIAGSFGDRVHLVRLIENRGEAAARNAGLQVARGEAIAMHDADDRMLAHRLRVQAEHLVAGGPMTGCVMGRARSFSHDGEPLPPWAHDADGSPSTYGTSLVLAWRSTFERVGGYDESFAIGTDSDWILRVRAAGLTVGLIDEDLTDRRWHDANASSVAGPPDRIELTRSVRKLLEQRRSRG